MNAHRIGGLPLKRGVLLLVAGVALLSAGLVRPAGAAAPADSLADLIARAAPGDTVTVPPGTYREQVVIDRPVTLLGEGRVIVDGGRRGDVIRITADDVTVRGFTVQGSARDVFEEPAGIRITGDRATVEDNVVRDSLYGIVMEDSAGHRVRRNEVSSIPEFGPERRGHALYVWHSDDTTIEDNRVRGAKDGIFLGFADRNRVERNRVTGARYGIHYMYANHNTFIGNVFRDSVAGAAIMFSRGITFRENEFAYNQSAASGYGLLFKDVDDVEMTDNLVHHNRLGVTLEGAPHTPGGTVLLRRNLIGYNDIALELATTAHATFLDNTFLGNLAQVATSGGGVEGLNTWSADGRGNYWDEYQGYDADGDGVGDLPFRYEGAFDDLTRRSEWVRAYAFTPARMALDMAARWFPAFRPAPSVVDEHPLTTPSLRLDAPAAGVASLPGLAAASMLAGLPLAGWWALAGRKQDERW